MSLINISIQDLKSSLTKQTIPNLKPIAQSLGVKNLSKMKKQ